MADSAVERVDRAYKRTMELEEMKDEDGVVYSTHNYASIPDYPLTPLDKSSTFSIFATNADKRFIRALSVSTYPMVTDRKTGKVGRDGEPNADCLYACVYSNRAILAVADGCNWGTRSAKASHDALEGLSSYLTSHEAEMTSLQHTGHLLLRAICEANKKVYSAGTELWQIGTTTLLCGVVAEVVKDEAKDEHEWYWICASVGDCKVMLWNCGSGKVTDITRDNRCADMRDPGGRLGPYAGKDPDLRNLALYFRAVKPGDILILCSDGVYDNFDPVFLGKKPRDIGLDYDDWKAVPDEVVERTKESFVTNYAAGLLKPLSRVTPTTLADTWIKHAVQQTAGSRKFMEENPGKRQPNDYKLFPGKMDHTSALAYLVGGRPSKGPKVEFPMEDATKEEKKKKKKKAAEDDEEDEDEEKKTDSPTTTTTTTTTTTDVVDKKPSEAKPEEKSDEGESTDEGKDEGKADSGEEKKHKKHHKKHHKKEKESDGSE